MRSPLAILLCLLSLAAIDVSAAQAVASQDTSRSRSGTWSATTANGSPLQGTWTASADSTGRSVTGTWTMFDAQGRTVANGGWSAAKASSQWTGAWRALVAGRDAEYSGTWTANVADLKGDASFVNLFDKALQSVVGGMWRMGSYSGPWAIRTLKQDGPP